MQYLYHLCSQSSHLLPLFKNLISAHGSIKRAGPIKRAGLRMPNKFTRMRANLRFYGISPLGSLSLLFSLWFHRVTISEIFNLNDAEAEG